MKKISLCNLHITLDVVEFYWFKVKVLFKIKFILQKQHKFEVKKILRNEQNSNLECPAHESSTLTITPQKTAPFVKHYSPNKS